MNKVILVFDKDNNLIKQIFYRTIREAKGNYKIFLKYGMVDYITCEKIEGLKFELI